MPISTPPFSYDLNPSGTSGVAVGPRICIVTDDLEAASASAAAASAGSGSGAGLVLSVLLPGQVGNILVRGSPCFTGYETPEGEEGGGHDECFFTVDSGGGEGSGGIESGWFSTGKCSAVQ